MIAPFRSERSQQVALNNRCLNLLPNEISVPKGSVLGSLFLLVCIIDFPPSLFSDMQLLGEDTLLFSVAHNLTKIVSSLNQDLTKLQN